jgi:hypothetical protein
MAAEVTFDYMRMMFTFGRRYQDYDFFIVTKTKSEQFRARNAIIETALRFGADYLLFLDDDQIIDWQDQAAHDPYMFLQTLLDADKDIVGGLYYHRGGEYRPVLMAKHKDGYRFMRDDEITGELQQVDVQGGGCMLINMKIFDKIPPPYFEPEMHSGEGQNLGTDIQLCKKAVEHGYEVWSHTGVVIGHLKQSHDLITPLNRDLYMAEAIQKKGEQANIMMDKAYTGYLDAALEYAEIDYPTMIEGAMRYNIDLQEKWDKYEDKLQYYKDRGKDQLCRQVYFHSRDFVLRQAKIITASLRGTRGFGLDFACGSGPVGYELLAMGHHVDFVDLDGAYAYNFLKWRVEQNGHSDRAGWKMEGPYDFVLMLDAIEHLPDWEEVLDNIIARMRFKAGFITNFFRNNDFDNPEHVSMDHDAVQAFLLERKLYPVNDMMYVKHDDIGPSVAVNKEE